MAQRRGDAAKAAAIDTILNTFEGSFLHDKKLYINIEDGLNGEVVQLCLAITMPKSPIAATGETGALVSTDASAWETPAVDLSEEDKAKVAKLLTLV